jgi:hypothetical protein
VVPPVDRRPNASPIAPPIRDPYTASRRSLAIHPASHRSAVPETTRAHGPTIARTRPVAGWRDPFSVPLHARAAGCRRSRAPGRLLVFVRGASGAPAELLAHLVDRLRETSGLEGAVPTPGRPALPGARRAGARAGRGVPGGEGGARLSPPRRPRRRARRAPLRLATPGSSRAQPAARRRRRLPRHPSARTRPPDARRGARALRRASDRSGDRLRAEVARRAEIAMCTVGTRGACLVAHTDGDEARRRGPPAPYWRITRSGPALRWLCPHEAAFGLLGELVGAYALRGDLQRARHAARLRLAPAAGRAARERVELEINGLDVHLN